MMLQVFLCVWRSSFSHSSRVGLLAANFLSFLSSEVLISTFWFCRVVSEFWVDSYFLSGLENIVLLSSGLHNFWWKVEWIIVLLITLKILSLDLCYFTFGQLLQFLGLCLSDLEKLQPLFLQKVFCSFMLPMLGIPNTCTLSHSKFFHNLLIFFFFFSVSFSAFFGCSTSVFSGTQIYFFQCLICC